LHNIARSFRQGKWRRRQGFFEVPNLEEKDITPRFSGPEKLFEGVVCLNNGVPPDKMRFKGYSADLKKEKGDEK